MHHNLARAFLAATLLIAAGTGAAQRPQLNVQTGHAKLVDAVTFTHDGKLLASGSVDKTIKLWDTTTGYELRVLKGHDGTVTAVAFSPDEKILASSSADKSIKLWDVATGEERKTLTGHESYVFSVAFSPDGKMMASGSADQTVKLWEVATWRELRTWTVESAPTFSAGITIAFSPDGKTLATGGETVKLWDVRTGKERMLRKLDESNSTAEVPVAFSYDGKVLASGGVNLQLWDVATGRALRTLGEPAEAVPFNSIAFSSDGQTLAAHSNSTKLWNYITGREIRTLNTGKVGVKILAFSSDGKTLASGNLDNTVTLWETTTGQLLRTLKGRASAVTSVASSRDGKLLAQGSWAGSWTSETKGRDTVKLWELTTGQLRTLEGPHVVATSIAFSGDGKKLTAGTVGDDLRLWDVATGQELRKFARASSSVALELPPELQQEAGQRKVVVVSSSSASDCVALSGDGQTLAGSGGNGTISLWDVATGRQLQTLKGHPDGVSALAFRGDDQTLASSGHDKAIKLWDVATGKLRRTLLGHSESVASVAFSPDGMTLASGGDEGQILLWGLATGRQQRASSFHDGPVTSVAFSRDGKTLASAGNDKTLKIWDVATGRLRRSLIGHTDYVDSVTFSSDGQILASGGSDAQIKLWDVATGRELASLIAVDQQDWLVVTPDGLFDGSPAAWNQILWRFSQDLHDVAPVEIFFNEFYYPGLLADLYAGTRPIATENISQKDRRQPMVKLSLADREAPSARITSRRVTVNIDVASAPAGAQDVRLFRNGSLVKVWRGDVLKGQSRMTLEASVPIVAGANGLTAYAFNRDNVKSADATLTLIGDDSLKRAGTLYILALAVNKYANPQFDLRYAVADAADFATELQRQEAKLKGYERVEVIPLHDQEATKAKVLSALTTLAERVQPEDAVVVYYAGHGTAQQNQFYLIPHDLGYLGARRQIDATGLQSILAHSISDRELERAFEGMDAGRFLLVIDACNSGQALEAEEKRRGPMNSKGLAQLAYEKGIYILTAAQSYQAALEPSELQHGLLTYALVEEGLKNAAADFEPNDGVVLLREWLNYATKRVPEIQEGRMRQAARSGRQLAQLAYVEGEETRDVDKRNVQRPRIFYRRELEARPFIVARY